MFLDGLVRVGIAVPQDQLGRVPNGNDPLLLSVPTGAPRGVYQEQHVIAPRFSFAYSPFDDNKTAIRGGFGVFFDRPEGNLIFSSTGVPPSSCCRMGLTSVPVSMMKMQVGGVLFEGAKIFLGATFRASDPTF